MPIVSSQVASDSPQIDGRRWITEQHLDQFGEDHPVSYMADAGFDAVDACAVRDAGISAQMAQAEIAANIQMGMTMGAAAIGQLTFNETTMTQNLQALAAQFSGATPTSIASMTAFMAALPGAELASVFNLTPDQIVALQSDAATLTATIEAAAGNLQNAMQSAGA